MGCAPSSLTSTAANKKGPSVEGTSRKGSRTSIRDLPTSDEAPVASIPSQDQRDSVQKPTQGNVPVPSDTTSKEGDVPADVSGAEHQETSASIQPSLNDVESTPEIPRLELRAWSAPIERETVIPELNGTSMKKKSASSLSSNSLRTQESSYNDGLDSKKLENQGRINLDARSPSEVRVCERPPSRGGAAYDIIYTSESSSVKQRPDRLTSIQRKITPDAIEKRMLEADDRRRKDQLERQLKAKRLSQRLEPGDTPTAAAPAAESSPSSPQMDRPVLDSDREPLLINLDLDAQG